MQPESQLYEISSLAMPPAPYGLSRIHFGPLHAQQTGFLRGELGVGQQPFGPEIREFAKLVGN
jgi:hypothetical protein